MEHQCRVEPEEDAKSEGTQGSQEAAPGRLAALDIDLEDKKTMHVAYNRVTKIRQGILGS